MTPRYDGTRTNIRMYFIFLENKSTGLHFAADNIGQYSLKFFFWAQELLFTLARGRFGRSRASKVTDLGAPIESTYATSY